MTELTQTATTAKNFIVHEKYTAFMNDLFDKAYVRKVNFKD